MQLYPGKTLSTLDAGHRAQIYLCRGLAVWSTGLQAWAFGHAPAEAAELLSILVCRKHRSRNLDSKMTACKSGSKGGTGRSLAYTPTEISIHRVTKCGLTLAELHVRVLTSFIKLIKLLQNLMKLIPNHVMV